MASGGLNDSPDKRDDRIDHRDSGKNLNSNAVVHNVQGSQTQDACNHINNCNNSDVTIYKRAIEKYNSSSSDEAAQDTSDELLQFEFDKINILPSSIVGADVVHKHVDDRHSVSRNDRCGFEPMPSTSRDYDGRQNERFPPRSRPREPTPEERAERLIREAELAKAEIFPVSGNTLVTQRYCKTAVIDEGYMAVGGHVDEQTYVKIQRGEYVDFGKLIQKDKVLVEEDQRLEMVVRAGRTFYVPVQETATIGSYVKWEQAFRVFANIYTKVNPHRSSELIEYNHVIHTISTVYAWDNIYMYDKDFRIHMGRNPELNWSTILQQAWSLRLKVWI